MATRPTAASLLRPVAGRSGAAAPAGRLRLTRRGRLLVLLVAALAVFAAFSVGRLTTAAIGARGPATTTVVVHSGESLWQLAERLAPASDPRSYVDRVLRLNHLSSSAVQAGQRLVVPSQ